jgi:putative Holliday junction resolvase
MVLIAQVRFLVWDFQPEMENKRFLGVDHGDARIGLALSDELGMLAHPLETLPAQEKPLDRIAAVVRDRGVATVVVGMPRNMDGSYGPAAEKVKAFIAELREKVPCPVVPWDERMTTLSAERALREAGRKAKNQRSIIDQAAAQIILQSWMDSQG